MNLYSKPIRILGLFVCVVCTFLILVPYGYKSGQAGPGFEYLGTLWVEEKYSGFEKIIFQALPGIVFSAYVVVFFIEKSTLPGQFLNFATLLLIYVGFYFVGMLSLGLFNILTGGIGALCINNLLTHKMRAKGVYIFLVGMAAGTVGLIAAYNFSDPGNTNKEGVTILFACLPWQIVIGLLLCLNTKEPGAEKLNDYISTNADEIEIRNKKIDD